MQIAYEKRCDGSESPSTWDRFVRFVGLLRSLYGVALDLPDPSEDLGEFCNSLVEGRDHIWRPQISGLSASSRFGLAHSLFLFRKVIPKKKPEVFPYVCKMALPSAPVDPSFEKFALSLTKQLFSRGWDRNYFRLGQRSKLTTTSCAEYSRAEGGSRGWSSRLDSERADFCEYVLRSTGCWLERSKDRPASVVQAVESGGKWRVISCPPAVDNALRPLHHAMYDHLSRYKWLLRGDAKPARFKDFVTKAGEVFVSGDYESATDNLNADLQKKILETVLGSSASVPQGIKDHAISTYSSLLKVGRFGSDEYAQSRGQLMGQLTSFPMLCLINYITFRYSFRGKTVPPVRVNGDDIVFRASYSDACDWMTDVEKGGLVLSKGKTLIHSRGFTLNSCPFWSSGRGVRYCGFVRPSAIWKNQASHEQIRTLHGRFYASSFGYGRARKDLVKEFFLRENSRSVYASRRSVTRGLGMACGESVLRNATLFDRECFYLSYPSEAPLPLERNNRLKGWEQVSAYRYSTNERRAWERLYSCAASDHTWFSDLSPTDLKVELSDIQSGCVPYGLPSGRKYRKMLGLSREQCWKLACRRRDTSVFGRCKFKKKGEMLWVMKDCSYTSNRIWCPSFVSSAGERWAGSDLKLSRPDTPPSFRNGWKSVASGACVVSLGADVLDVVERFSSRLGNWSCRKLHFLFGK